MFLPAASFIISLVLSVKILPTGTKEAADRYKKKARRRPLIRFLGDSKSKMMPEKKEGITKCKWLTPSEIVLIMKDSRPLVHYLLEFVLQDPDYKNFRKVWRKL